MHNANLDLVLVDIVLKNNLRAQFPIPNKYFAAVIDNAQFPFPTEGHVHESYDNSRKFFDCQVIPK